MTDEGMITPCGKWERLTTGDYRGLYYGEIVLFLDPWFCEPDGISNYLKAPVRLWLNENFGVENYGFIGVGYRDKLIFKTEEQAVIFRLFWEDRVPVKAR